MSFLQVVKGLDVIIWGILAVMFLRVLYAMRQSITRIIKVMLLSALGVVVVNLIAVVAHKPELHRWGFVGFLLGFSLVRPRSRHIPSHERRKAIAAYERKGEKYDPRKHDLDHRWAFSKGGSNTADNLRVLERGENRRRGNRSRPRDLWR
jgi:hypothetical protein